MGWDALTAVSTAIATVVVLVTGLLLFMQLREMKKATVAACFSSIVSLLQAERVRNARAVLTNVNEKDFTKWTANQIKLAEIACSTYDTVGIMLRKKVIDDKMVTAEWRNSIIQCWEHAQPMIASYRQKRGNDFWDDFEWLYKQAKNSPRYR